MFFRPGSSLGDEAAAFGFIARYYANLGVDHVNIDTMQLRGIFNSARSKFPHDGGIERASPFKQAAFLVCLFAGEKPISTKLPADKFGGHWTNVADHPSAVLALEMAIESLYGATLTWEDGTHPQLTERIVLSRHSFVDIVDAIAGVSANTGYKLVSVLLEQMAYKENRNCQYPA